MAIRAEWVNQEQTILLLTHESNWTWDEFYNAVQEGYNNRKNHALKLNIIFDLRAADRLPEGVVTQFKRISKLPEAGGDHFIVVSNSGLIRSIFVLFQRMYPTRGQYYQMTSTLQEAYDLLTTRIKTPEA